MKSYNIYLHPNRDIEAVKQGWSWPGCLFSTIWALVKKIWWLAGALLAAGIAINIISNIIVRVSPTPGALMFSSILTLVLCIGIFVWIGLHGNKYREDNLLKRGFELKATNVTAVNPAQAIAHYFQKKQDGRGSASKAV